MSKSQRRPSAGQLHQPTPNIKMSEAKTTLSEAENEEVSSGGTVSERIEQLQQKLDEISTEIEQIRSRFSYQVPQHRRRR